MPELSETAPAQSIAVETPNPIPAVDAAVASGDQAAFREARRAVRAGTPLPDVQPAAPEPPADAPAVSEPKPVSKRQQEINDHIRRATAAELRASQLEAEIARLKGEPAPDEKPAAASARAPTWQEALKTPDIARPLLSEAQFFEAYPDAPYAAYARYWERYDTRLDQAQAQTRAATDRHAQIVQERVSTFTERMAAAKAADPDLASKIPPSVATARPLSGLSPQEQGAATFSNFVAEAAFQSDAPAALLTHLHAHPDDAATIAALHPAQWLPALLRLDGRLSGPVAVSAPPKTLSDAPEPPVALGSRATDPADPIDSAVRTGDVAAFKAARLRQRAATRK